MKLRSWYATMWYTPTWRYATMWYTRRYEIPLIRDCCNHKWSCTSGADGFRPHYKTIAAGIGSSSLPPPTYKFPVAASRVRERVYAPQSEALPPHLPPLPHWKWKKCKNQPFSANFWKFFHLRNTFFPLNSPTKNSGAAIASFYETTNSEFLVQGNFKHSREHWYNAFYDYKRFMPLNPGHSNGKKGYQARPWTHKKHPKHVFPGLKFSSLNKYWV